MVVHRTLSRLLFQSVDREIDPSLNVVHKRPGTGVTQHIQVLGPVSGGGRPNTGKKIRFTSLKTLMDLNRNIGSYDLMTSYVPLGLWCPKGLLTH